MKITILSREDAQTLLESDSPERTAVISFYDPPAPRRGYYCKLLDYSSKTDYVFQIAIHDIDLPVV